MLPLTGMIPHLYRGRFQGKVWLGGKDTENTPLWALSETAGLVFQNLAAQMLAATVEEETLFGLEKVSFIDTEDGKTQDGWLLKDVLFIVLPETNMEGAQVVVSSSSREKSAMLRWEEIDEPANMVMFDLSNRGTLKLVSLLPQLDTRDEWVQDVDRIEIT